MIFTKIFKPKRVQRISNHGENTALMIATRLFSRMKLPTRWFYNLRKGCLLWLCSHFREVFRTRTWWLHDHQRPPLTKLHSFLDCFSFHKFLLRLFQLRNEIDTWVEIRFDRKAKFNVTARICECFRGTWKMKHERCYDICTSSHAILLFELTCRMVPTVSMLIFPGFIRCNVPINVCNISFLMESKSYQY